MKNRLYRAAVLVTAMLLTSIATPPVRAAKVADGVVHFTGAMLGEPTCTLENPQVTVDFGTINVDRKGAVPANPLGSPRTVTFRLTKCVSYIQKVNMTVNFDAAPAWGVTDLIGNQGTAGKVAGVLTCPAEAPAQGVNCTAGNRFSTGETVSGTVTNGGVSFPLTVSLVTFEPLHPSTPHMPEAGNINMTVNFTFEEA
ncbi:fimbrial protein [Salmonella enterica]|uniref:fimbrial protein n=1 Tax=Salmonella enterica TaxID=28901 RepID=UPI000FC0D82B|nr:fimbrial protein [Salmonella enterica]EAA7541796.1 type 1 fimbrial protein [Salmonella enterica subsp. enterica serovar Give]EAP3746313.1 type 1 fimbrial protein [Salmonella enterica subsp. enterica serovar Minnesota]EAA8836565.1 type 1 fimbrial protein [Salmonella enterica subsp. enterica serovar Give]EAR0111229.1 type 1 fimbrial protein [Salmonella enterica subsp. enterica serovar Give]EAR0125142.1 type 1 fimbrial protein [Salmonella enterica subsp. enterica serovar Give]